MFSIVLVSITMRTASFIDEDTASTHDDESQRIINWLTSCCSDGESKPEPFYSSLRSSHSALKRRRRAAMDNQTPISKEQATPPASIKGRGRDRGRGRGRSSLQLHNLSGTTQTSQSSISGSEVQVQPNANDKSRWSSVICR